MPAMQMALLERRELDAGIWRMATEPPTGFTSLRLHESAFLVAMPEEHHLIIFHRPAGSYVTVFRYNAARVH